YRLQAIVETILVTHTNSELALTCGLDMQHRFLAHLLVSLVIAHTHSHNNPAFVDVLQEFQRHSLFVTAASGSAPVPVGDVPKVLSLVPGGKGHTGTRISSVMR